MKLISAACAMLLFSGTTLLAQSESDSKYTKITAADFILPASPVVDNNTGAVILSDIGSVKFTGNKNSRWISYVFQRKTRIKIINKEAFKLATVTIGLYGNGKNQDKLDSIYATTFNLENGKVTETDIKPEDIFEDKLGTYHTQKKFTLAAVKEGSIIEYSYIITSLYFADLPTWDFQHVDYPCLYSSFRLATPDLVGYLLIHKGIDALPVPATEEETGVFYAADLRVATKVHIRQWVMKDVMAYKTEPYTGSATDLKDNIEFQLAQTYNGEDIYNHLSWKDITADMLQRSDFGSSITTENTPYLVNTVEKITHNDDNLLNAARHIYAYVRDNFTVVNNDYIFLTKDLYEVNKNRKGSVAEINLLLTALLKQKGLIASPVILSTASYGVHSVNYPMLNKFNYVISMLKIYGDTLYLDASQPQLGFGKLPLDCYNGHARIIGDKDTGNIFLYAESVKEQGRTTIFIQNDEKATGKMTGTMQIAPGYHQSYDIRAMIKEKGMDDYFKKMQNIFSSDVKIENTGIDSLKSLEGPVAVHCDFGFSPGTTEPGFVYYNPVLILDYKENPFKAEERKYPIVLPQPVDKLYIFNMEIPAGYTIEELPKSAKVMFNGNEGFYEYIIQKDDASIQLRSHVKIDRTIFRADEYNSLRDFFGFIVKKQNEQIVFKPKKGK